MTPKTWCQLGKNKLNTSKVNNRVAMIGTIPIFKGKKRESSLKRIGGISIMVFKEILHNINHLLVEVRERIISLLIKCMLNMVI